MVPAGIRSMEIKIGVSPSVGEARSEMGVQGCALEMEETLQVYQCMVLMHDRVLAESNRFRSQSMSTSGSTPSKWARAIRAIYEESGSSGSGSSLSESDVEVKQHNFVWLLLQIAQRNLVITGDLNQDHGHNCRVSQKACTQCRSGKHDDRGCWKRLTCQICDRS